MRFQSFFQICQKKFNQNIVVKGTVILIITGLLTRLIGFYNRIFLSQLIGATNLGIFQLILPLYMIAFALTNYGPQLSLTKLVSEYFEQKKYATVHNIFKIGFCISLILSLLFSTIMYKNAQWICIHILRAHNCYHYVKILSFSIPFMAMKGSIHGYFLGLKKPDVHGYSDLIEQISKIIGTWCVTYFFIPKNQYNANVAIIGFVFSDIVAFFYSAYRYYTFTKKNSQFQIKKKTDLAKSKIFSIFIQNTLPMTGNKLLLSILQSMESIMIPSVLLLYYNSSNASLAHYGIFTGMAFPFIMFPATIPNSLSMMLLPAVSSAQSAKDKKSLVSMCNNSIHFCLLIGMFSLINFYIYGHEFGILLFDNKEAGMYIYQLSFLCPLIYLATTLASITNGLGYASSNLLYTAIGTIIRILFIQITVPKIGLPGYMAGLFISYLFITLACLRKTLTIIPYTIYFKESILIPSCTFTLFGCIGYYVFQKIIDFSNCSNTKCIIHMAIIIGITAILTIPLFIKQMYRLQKSVSL